MAATLLLGSVRTARRMELNLQRNLRLEAFAYGRVQNIHLEMLIIAGYVAHRAVTVTATYLTAGCRRC